MDFNLKHCLSFLIVCLLLFCSNAFAAITFEAVTIGGLKVYSGDTIPTAASFSINLTTTSNLSTLTATLDGSDTALTPSTTTAGTITSSYSTTLADGTHSLRITAKDINNDTKTWEATNLSVDSASSLSILGPPLNFPNPCTASDTSTAISYTLSKAANVKISIHDLMGNLIRSYDYTALANGGLAHYNEVTWDLKNEAGSDVGNGIYIYLVIGDGKVLGKGKIAIIK